MGSGIDTSPHKCHSWESYIWLKIICAGSNGSSGFDGPEYDLDGNNSANRKNKGKRRDIYCFNFIAFYCSQK